MELPAVPEAVPRARAAITELCECLDVAEGVVERVRIAVTEACTNCVLHAFPGDRVSSTYMLETRVEARALVVIVHDCGVGIYVAPSSDAEIGLGLRLINELADRVDVSSRPGHGTRVEMRFTPELAAV
jgi:stage II sporulation protein AB (anti-sigma F factor)